MQERNKESQVPANPGQAGRFSSRPRSPCIPGKHYTSQYSAWYPSVLFLFLQLDAVSLVSTEPSSCCLLYPRRHPVPGLSFLTIDFDFLLSCYYVLAQRFHLISRQPEQRRQTPRQLNILGLSLDHRFLSGHKQQTTSIPAPISSASLWQDSIERTQDQPTTSTGPHHTSNRSIPTSSPPVDTGHRIQETGHTQDIQDTGPLNPTDLDCSGTSVVLSRTLHGIHKLAITRSLASSQLALALASVPEP